MLTGGCLCRAVRYRAAGTPEFQGLCHCCDCQRLSGSGQPADRHYCPSCLSQLFGFSDIMPSKTNVYAGSLDDNTRFKPTFAIFVRSRPPWDKSSAGL